MANIHAKGVPPIHGKSHTAEYKVWKSIKLRCNRPNSIPYKWYGARGIKIDPVWNKSFVAFLDYVGLRPSKEYSIERIDNNGNYEPGNVEWRTQKEQSNNRRSNKIITYNGESMTMSQWCDNLHLPYSRVSKRISKYGWSPERAFTEPVQIHISK